MARLKIDYTEAIASTQAMIKEMTSLDAQLAKLKQTATDSAKSMGSAFGQVGGKSAKETLKAQKDVTKEYERQATHVKQSTLEQMKAQTAIIQQRTHANRLGEDYKLQAQAIKEQVNAMLQKLSVSGQLGTQEAKVTAELQEQLKIIQSQMTYDTASQATGYFGSELGRRVGWFLSGTAFYGSINAAKEAVRAIKDVEFGMVEIGRVMEDATFQTESYRDALLGLGVEYGQSFENVQAIALRWAQSGYNVADSLELTRTSLLALNTAELDAQNATEAMVGIMAQWQLQAEDLELVMDKINKTADNYTLTSQDLVDGLLRSSGAARVMNMSIDETIALLTVMREASGRTGREVGNALNSILSYIQRPKAINIMESLGIDVFADEARTQFRGAMDIFQDIAANWDTASDVIKDGFIEAAEDAGLFNEELAEAIGMTETWTDVQKRDLAQGAAGVFRRNYFIGMIERLSNAQGVLNGLMTAGGYSQAENERTMDSLEKKVQSLKTSVTQLAVALGDTGLLETLKSIVDGLGAAIGAFNNLDPRMKDFIVSLLAIMTTVKALDLTLKLLGIGTLPNLGTAIKNLTLGTATLTSVTTKATAALGFLGKAFPLIAISATVAGIFALTNALKEQDGFLEVTTKSHKELSGEMDAYNKAANQAIADINAQAKTAENYANKLFDLAEKTNRNTYEQGQMAMAIDQLNAIIPGLNLHIDATTGSLNMQRSEVEKNIDSFRRLGMAQAYLDLTGESNKAIAAAQLEHGRLLTEYEKLGGYRDTSYGLGGLITAVPDAIHNVKVTNLQGQIRKQSVLINQAQKQADEAYENYLKYVDDLEKVLKPSHPDNSISDGSTTTSTGKSNVQKAIDEEKRLMDARLKHSTDWINYQKSIGQLTLQEEIAAWMRVLNQQSDNIDAVKTATTNLYRLRQQLADEDAKLQEGHIRHLTTLGIYSTQEQIDAYREMYKVRAETLEDEQKRVENLFSLYKRLLTEQQASLRKAYDERIRMIDEEADRQKEALQDRISSLKEELDLLNRADKERSYEQTIAGIQEEIAYWQVRVSEEARKKVIELEEKLDEERYKKQLEDEKQAINDKIDALEDEVKSVDKIAKEEKAKWEQSYKKLEASFSDHNANMLAMAASMSEDAYQQWLNNYFIPLQTSLSSGSFGSFDSLASGGFGIATITHDWGMSETDYQRFLANGERWAELNRQGYTSATNVEMRKLNEENDKLRRKYGRDVSLGEYPKFHTGGKTLSYGIARYKPGELVFPPNLSEKLEMLIAMLGHQDFGKQAVGGDKTVKIGTLLNIERNVIEDEADSTILVREIARAVQRI